MGLEIEQVGAVIAYTFTDSSDESVNIWAASLEGVLQETPPDTPFYVLVDVSGRNIEFTAHARAKSADLFPRFREQPGRMAYIFSGVTAPHYARIFFAGLGRLAFEVEFFDSRAAALAWLQNHQP